MPIIFAQRQGIDSFNQANLKYMVVLHVKNQNKNVGWFSLILSFFFNS